MNQLDIEKQYSRKIIRQLVKADVDVSAEVFAKCLKALEVYMLDNSYYPSKHKRINELHQHTMTMTDIVLELFASVLPYQVITPIQSIAANLGSRLGYRYVLDGVKTAAEIIAVCEKSGLYTIYHSSHQDNDTDTLGVLPHYKLSQHVIDYIENSMFLPPMICKPKPWHNNDNTGGGYLHSKGSCILGALNHHNHHQNLNHLNILQSIPWELNKHIVDMDEVPNKVLETAEQQDQFENFKQEAVKVRNMLINTGNRFYFQWKYDKRGRSYSTGYHVNLQSTEYQKASLQFKHKEVLTS